VRTAVALNGLLAVPALFALLTGLLSRRAGVVAAAVTGSLVTRGRCGRCRRTPTV
jgi:hypothetical protein